MCCSGVSSRRGFRENRFFFFMEADDGIYCIDGIGLPEAATATATGRLWWKMQARYAFRRMECASRAPLGDGAAEVADNQIGRAHV